MDKINGKTKKIIVAGIIFSIILTVVFANILIIQYNNYVAIVNKTVSDIVNEVIEKYPDIDEEKIIKIINGKEQNESKDILSKYGYENEANYIQELKNTMQNSIIIECVLVFTFCILWIIILLVYRKKENMQIDKIDKYFKQLNKKNYELKISENSDDEFSKLRNEIYKTTILLKETAENSEKEKGQLSNALADISHQIKTPLTSITIMLDNICENPDMDEKTKNEFIKDISKQIDWISSLIISLLKLAKIDAGAITLNKQNVKVKTLIENVLKNLAVIIEIKNIQIVENVPENIEISVDYKWQLEALTNIIKNAIEHGQNNSRIFIEAEDSSVFLKLKITDEGKGIEKEDLKHIFERFYKGKNSSENSIGIGLALSKSIIEKENGYITVNSEEGKGATFEIKYLR